MTLRQLQCTTAATAILSILSQTPNIDIFTTVLALAVSCTQADIHCIANSFRVYSTTPQSSPRILAKLYMIVYTPSCERTGTHRTIRMKRLLLGIFFYLISCATGALGEGIPRESVDTTNEKDKVTVHSEVPGVSHYYIRGSSTSRQLPGYFDGMNFSNGDFTSQEAAFVAGMLFFVVIAFLLCCCLCGGCSLWDILALVCIWDICCASGNGVGDFGML